MKYNTHYTPDFDYSRLDSIHPLQRERALALIHSPETFRELQARQLLAQMGLGTDTRNNPYEWNDFRSIVQHCFTRSNQSYKESETRSQLFARAWGTSDFKELLTETTNKVLAKGWEQASTTYQDWTFPTTVKDFKSATLISMDHFSKLERVNEGQTILGSHSPDSSTSFKLETFGKIFSISRRAIYNDDLEVLKTLPLLMGASARQAIEETVWSVLLANPILSDGIALVHNDHNNLISGELNVANLDVARAALAKQTSNGVLLNLQPSHIIVPKALEGTARTIASAQYPDGSLKVISSAHLDLVSSTAWYLVSNTRPAITVATLTGFPLPRVTVKNNLLTDEVDYRVLFDFAVAANEHRSIVKSTGV